MKDIKRTDLIACAVELNTLLDPDPKIKTVGIKTEDLIKAITKAAGLIEEGDKISEATSDMLITLEIKIPEGVIVETADDPADEIKATDGELALEDLISLAKQMNDIMALAPAIEVADESTFDELKAVILENCYDGKDCQIYATDEFSAENWVTLKSLGIVPVTEDGAPVEEVPVKKGKDKVGKEKPAKTEKPAKEKAEKAEKKEKPAKKEKEVKGPGVIKTIVSTIKDHGPITKEQILQKLVEAFPERDADAMKRTINVQIPTRINKEQDFQIENTDKGWKVVK